MLFTRIKNTGQWKGIPRFHQYPSVKLKEIKKDSSSTGKDVSKSAKLHEKYCWSMSRKKRVCFGRQSPAAPIGRELSFVLGPQEWHGSFDVGGVLGGGGSRMRKTQANGLQAKRDEVENRLNYEKTNGL